MRADTFDSAATMIRILVELNYAELMNDIRRRRYYFPMMETQDFGIGMLSFSVPFYPFPDFNLKPYKIT